MLILGLADEIPPGTFNGDIRVRSPFCFIRPAETPTYADFENGGPANLDHQQLLGVTEDPGGGIRRTPGFRRNNGTRRSF